MISRRKNVKNLCLWGILVAVIWLSSTYVTAEPPDDKIRMSREKIEGSRFDRFTGIVRIQAPMQAFKDLVYDVDTYPQWLHGCRETHVLKGEMSDHRLYIYFIYAAPDLPWYLFMAPRPKKRDMVLRLEWEEDPATGRLTVMLMNVDPQKEPDLEDIKIPSDPDLVTVTQISVLWEFTPGADDTVMVTHTLYIDPNHKGEDLGIINRYAKSLVEESLKNVRNRLPVR